VFNSGVTNDRHHVDLAYEVTHLLCQNEIEQQKH